MSYERYYFFPSDRSLTDRFTTQHSSFDAEARETTTTDSAVDSTRQPESLREPLRSDPQRTPGRAHALKFVNTPHRRQNNVKSDAVEAALERRADTRSAHLSGRLSPSFRC